MNKNKKIARKIDNNIFNTESPLLGKFKSSVIFGETPLERDPRRAAVCRKIIECIDDFLKEKDSELYDKYHIIDKELFINRSQDKISINISNNSEKVLDFLKMHLSELQNRLNRKCKGFVLSIDNDFPCDITINIKEIA